MITLIPINASKITIYTILSIHLINKCNGKRIYRKSTSQKDSITYSMKSMIKGILQNQVQLLFNKTTLFCNPQKQDYY